MLKVREFEIIVLGATGFTGSLCVEYLAKSYRHINWGIAGRSEQKLQAVKKSYQERFLDNISHIPCFVVDMTDENSLIEVARRTKVILTTVGPFLLHGEKVVSACIKSGTDYIDSTGEFLWVKEMQLKYHDAAVKARVKITSCCGFDSIPSEMGVLSVTKKLKEKGVVSGISVHGFIDDIRGEFSGGTAASMFEFIDQVQSKKIPTRTLLSPYSLLNDDDDISRLEAETPLATEPQTLLPGWSDDHGCYLAPFIMSGVNIKNVHKTNATTGFQNGRDFIYREHVACKKSFAGYARAFFIQLVSMILIVLAVIKPIRGLLKSLAPKQGSGPSRDTLDNGFLRMTFIGRGLTRGKTTTVKCESKLTLTGADPGYKGTGIMLVEAALCMALDRSTLPERFGFLSPGAALDDQIAKRLEKADPGVHII